MTTPEIAALRRTHACLRLLQGLEFSTSKLQLVLNRVESKTRVSSSEAADALGHPITWRVANDYAAMQSSAIGSPVVLAQPKSRLSRDIRGIARQLAGAPVAPLEAAGCRGNDVRCYCAAGTLRDMSLLEHIRSSAAAAPTDCHSPAVDRRRQAPSRARAADASTPAADAAPRAIRDRRATTR